MESRRNILIAARLAEGVPHKEIAKEFGVHKNTVGQVSGKANIRDIIERAHEKIVTTTLSKAVENMDYLVQNYKTAEDKQEKEHGYKASEKVLEAAGLLSSHSMSVVHQTYIANQTNVTNPIIDQLISKHLAGFALDKPVWEVENAPIEIEESGIEEHPGTNGNGQEPEAKRCDSPQRKVKKEEKKVKKTKEKQARKVKKGV